MHTYETKLMSTEKLEKFLMYFNDAIGTDFEINEDPDGSDDHYVMCFELEAHEVRMLSDYEEANS